MKLSPWPPTPPCSPSILPPSYPTTSDSHASAEPDPTSQVHGHRKRVFSDHDDRGCANAVARRQLGGDRRRPRARALFRYIRALQGGLWWERGHGGAPLVGDGSCRRVCDHRGRRAHESIRWCVPIM
ncbi:hypothetical protein BC936DRAFT_139033, partial [Jimgerdemannia flammicorona]